MYKHNRVCALWGGLTPIDGKVHCPLTGKEYWPDMPINMDCLHCIHWVENPNYVEEGTPSVFDLPGVLISLAFMLAAAAWRFLQSLFEGKGDGFE